jgi:lysophospholipase L1-like esterase
MSVRPERRARPRSFSDLVRRLWLPRNRRSGKRIDDAEAADNVVRARRAAFALVPALLLCIAAEGWFRVHPLDDAYATNAGIVEPDPDLIWRLRPLATGPLKTNELGLRDTPYRADADFKILVLGDSVAWGNGIASVDALFAVRLEHELNAGGRGLSFEVINAAVPGYSTFQELGWLARDGLALGPDLLVLQFCLNDVVERYRALAEYGGNRSFLGVDTRAAVRGVYGAALRTSRAFEAAARGVQGLLRDRERFVARNLARDRLDAGLQRAWERVEAELDETAALAREHGLPMLLLIAPFRFQLDDPTALRQPQDRLERWAGARGIETIDVLRYFDRLPDTLAASMFSDESHFSVAGHAFVAEMLLVPVERALARAYPERYAERQSGR